MVLLRCTRCDEMAECLDVEFHFPDEHGDSAPRVEALCPDCLRKVREGLLVEKRQDRYVVR